MNNNNVKKYDESYSCKVIYVKLYAKKDVDQKRDQHEGVKILVSMESKSF